MKNFKIMAAALLLAGSVGMGACQKDHTSLTSAEINNQLSLFPTPPSEWLSFAGSNYYSSGFVGDVMPYYDNGKFHIFYLHDGDGANDGFHPIHAFETGDFTQYTYDGKMIPFGAVGAQDLAVGTGSVVKVGSTYYFYYTGHNDQFRGSKPVEGIMYATSTDLKIWTKKTGFNLLPPATFDQNDFRDPYVFFNASTNEYWMLVAARTNEQAVVTLFTSANPATDTWVSKGPIYTTDDNSYYMLECPDLFQMGSKWYLVFSENQTQKTTHYRIANSISGPWTTPAVDVFDGEYFYAAKTATDGTNRYLFGWDYRKDGNSDYGGKIWGGSLVVHQLVQNTDGTLSTKTPTAIAGQLTKQAAISQVDSNKITVSGNNYSIAANTEVHFSAISGQKKITTTISGLQTGGEAGILFALGRPDNNGDHYKLKLKNGVASFVKVQGTDEYTDAQVPFSFTSGQDIQLTIVIDNSNVVVDINGKTNLTDRIYWLSSAKWGVYAQQNAVSFNQLQLFGF